MDALSRAMVKNKHLQDLTNAKPSEVAAVVDKWKDLLPPDRWLAGVPLVTTTRPFPNEAAQAANLLAGHLAQSGAVKKLVKDDADALTKKKPALMKDGTSANKYASGAVDQVAATGLATQKLLAFCTDPVIATAGTAIGLVARRAAMGEGIERDKLDVDINYLKTEQNLLMRRRFPTSCCQLRLSQSTKSKRAAWRLCIARKPVNFLSRSLRTVAG